MAKYYRKAHELKRKERNQDLWLQGLYFYDALCDVSPVLHAFARKGTKPTPYPAEPYALTSKEVKERKEREERLRVDKMKAKMAAWAAKTNIQMAIRAEKEVKQNLKSRKRYVNLEIYIRRCRYANAMSGGKTALQDMLKTA